MVGLAISGSLQLPCIYGIRLITRPRNDSNEDHTLRLPDELLLRIFQTPSFNMFDRDYISLVCRRWCKLEGQSRQRVLFMAEESLALFTHMPSLLSRFDSITKLALQGCLPELSCVDDEGLVLISKKCRNLTTLALIRCLKVTDEGLAEFAKNCVGLKELKVRSCKFGAAGFNSVLNSCLMLEDLYVCYLYEVMEIGLIGTDLEASSLKRISLSLLHNGVGQCFEPLILCSQNLRKLHLERCSGGWDIVFTSIGKNNHYLEQVCLEYLNVTDVGLAALDTCTSLEVLHLAKIPLCTNTGISSIVEGCINLRKLHIDGCKTGLIGDIGIHAIAQHCPNIQELGLANLDLTPTGLTAIVSNCLKLGQLTFSKCNVEIACIADKCLSLRKLSLKKCRVSKKGLSSLVNGFPSLQEVEVSKCKGVGEYASSWLKQKRGSLFIQFQPVSILPRAFCIVARHILITTCLVFAIRKIKS